MSKADHTSAPKLSFLADVVSPTTLRPYELKASTPCRACGYDLRGQRSDGRCPECGTPIEATLRDALEFAPPAHIHRLALGATVKLWGVAAALLCFLVVGMGWSHGVAMWMRAVVGLVWVLAMWLLTTPDPSPAEAGNALTGRTLLRATYAPMFGLLLLWWLVGSDLMRAAPRPAAAAAAGVLLLGALVEIGLEFKYLGRLGVRLGDPLLALRTRVVMWGFTISLGLCGLAALPLSGVHRPGGRVGTLGCFGSLGWVGLLIFTFTWVLLLLRYRFCLNDAEHQAAVHQARRVAPAEGEKRAAEP